MTGWGLGQKGLILVFLVVFGAGCAGWGKPEVSNLNRLEALSRIDRLLEKNRALLPYKGIGQMWFLGPEGNWSIRGAWVGAPPGRFRVEALGLTGQPLAKLICDKRSCSFLFSENGCFKEVKRNEKSLKPLTGVAVDVDDLVLLLGGGVPVYPHDSAWIEPAEGGGEVLVLRQRWGGIVEKLFFSPGGDRIDRIEIYGFTGLRYQAEIGPVLTGQSDLLPEFVRIVNDEKAGMQIMAERGWTEAVLPEDVFVPKLPDALRCD